MIGLDYAIIKKILLFTCFSISLTIAGCGSCSNDEPEKTSGSYLDVAQSAADRNAEHTADVQRRVQEVENEQKEASEKAKTEDARRAEADPRNVPFGSSKDIEFTMARLRDPEGGYHKFVNVDFMVPNCVSFAGISFSFGNVSETDNSWKITYSVRVDSLGQGGYKAFAESLKGCNMAVPMTIISESKSYGKGLTPKPLGFNFSEYGVRISGP